MNNRALWKSSTAAVSEPERERGREGETGGLKQHKGGAEGEREEEAGSVCSCSRLIRKECSGFKCSPLRSSSS